MKNKTASRSKIPQTNHTWFLCLRELPLEKSEESTRIALLMILDLTQDEAIRLDIYETLPDPEFVWQQLWKSMSQPELKDQSAQRPKEIIFEQADLLKTLTPALREIQVGAHLGEPPAMVDALITGLIQSLSNSPQELPGLLSVPGTNPKMIASLFDSAAYFYRSAPWKRMIDYQTLSVFLDPPGERIFVQVMGHGGVEYGLTFYTSWEDVLRLFEHTDSPMDSLPEAGVNGLTFETQGNLPIEDQAGIRKYGWKTTGRKLYPLPVTFSKDGEAERPTRQDLLYYEALMRGLPEFIDRHLVEDGQGDFNPVEAIIESRHYDGPLRLTIHYLRGFTSR